MHYYICMGKCYKMAICCLFYLLKSLEVFDAFIVSKLFKTKNVLVFNLNIL